MKTFEFDKPAILISEWLPMGRNNLLALNRHLGSHKKYNSPTEFGMKGEVENTSEACFKMESSGCFLQPVSYEFSSFLRAKIKTNFADTKEKGLDIDKDGSCLIGLKLDDKIPIENTKELIRNIESEFTNQFISLLTESQQNLLKSAYGVTKVSEISKVMSSYSLVLVNNFEPEIVNTKTFLAQNKNVLEPVTDWITNHFTINNTHVFIGIKAMVCVSNELTKPIKDLLKGILFQKTIFTMSLQLFSNLWAINKRIININKGIKTANYNKLKNLNGQLSELNNNFSQQNIINEILINAIENKQIIWKKLLEKNKTIKKLDIGEGLVEELEKATNRNLLIRQLQTDITNSKTLLQNKISMMMTKNGQKLNLTLLLLTLFSVTGISEVFGLSFWKTVIVILALIPFIIFTFFAFTDYRKNFLSKNN